MIVKSLTRSLKNPQLHQLILYLNEGRESLDNEPHFCLRYNTTGNTAKEIANDFERNNKFIKKRTSRQVGIYQFILSFHPRERHLLDDSKLFTLGKCFCNLMDADNAIVYLRPHKDKNHTHLHCVLSASEYGSGKSRRISRNKFKQIQRGINLIQQKLYPELSYSLQYLDVEKSRESNLGIPLPKKMKEVDGSIRAKKRGQKSQLEILRSQLLEIAKKHPQKQDFVKAINAEKSMSVYYRGNSKAPTGIITQTGKKFRFIRLALNIENLQRDVRLHELTQQQNKNRDKEISRER